MKEEKEENATTPVEATETATPVAATETAAPVKEEVKAEKSEKEILDFVTPTETFDWEADEANFGEYTRDEVTKMQNLYSDTVTTPNKGDIVKGIVVSVGDKDVVLNIGFKSDGMVPTNEFRDTPDLKMGDEVEVLVEEQEDKLGQLVLSRKRAKIQRSWDNINSALEEDKIINGFVKSRTKGGLIVDVNGVEAFLPGSQIDIKPIRDYDAYVGKTMEFKVVKINHEFKNVVVSHKILIEDDLESQKQE
ncbi:MAG: small subunit ribosomal protein S1, partial [Sphingobacteriales bacterium]